ncbi:uncharacterized protein [Venturia canescens]|uniref:uncharacterized protein n=1 Tax=Venturia canescens TaxID=32260 RepID=UPI001C9CE740|nr:uncharacterized protein LOC122406770 [Venturia canescens]
METVNKDLGNLHVTGDHHVPDASSTHPEDLASSGSPTGSTTPTETTSPRPVATESENDRQPRNRRGKRAGWRVKENMRMRLLNDLQNRAVNYMVARNVRAMNHRRENRKDTAG